MVLSGGRGIITDAPHIHFQTATLSSWQNGRLQMKEFCPGAKISSCTFLLLQNLTPLIGKREKEIRVSWQRKAVLDLWRSHNNNKNNKATAGGWIFFQRHPASFTVIASELRGRWREKKTGLKQSSPRQEAASVPSPPLPRGCVFSSPQV